MFFSALRRATLGGARPLITLNSTKINAPVKRFMGGGGGGHHEMVADPMHTQAGTFFGFVMWFWVFYRFREDGAVLLGLRHPWEHAPGDHDDHEEDEHHDFEAVDGDLGVLQTRPTIINKSEVEETI